MREMIILGMLIIFISGCIQQTQEKTEEKPETKECVTDSDCIVGGCSGQVCSPKSEGSIITTCEWIEKYACYKLSKCSCINNKCQWKETEEFKDCLKK